MNDPVGSLFFIMASQKNPMDYKSQHYQQESRRYKRGRGKIFVLFEYSAKSILRLVYKIKVNLKHLTERNDGVEDL